MILLVGLISVFNVYKLGRSIDGLITDNYKSIDAAKSMDNSIEKQEKAVLKYIQGRYEEGVNLFYEGNDEFSEIFHAEKNNITESGEGDLVEVLNKDYVDFVKMFANLQEFSKNHSDVEIENFYEDKIIESIERVRTDLKEISKLNECSMFDKKTRTRLSAESSTNLIFLLSIIAGVSGLGISLIYTNKYLKPIKLLTNTIKSVKEGEINKEAPILYDDEVGLLAREFNNMTSRLYKFEKSTKGSLLEEKDRFMAIIKSISDPLMVLDESFKLKFVNDSCEKILKVDEENIKNKHFLQVINDGKLYDHAFDVINNNLYDDGKMIEIQIEEKKYFFNITVTAIRDKDCKVNGIIMLFKNVTELKQVEILKTDFIGTISHELKTPLTSIVMGIDLMLDKNLGALNNKQKQVVETIKEDSESLNNLVSNLLKISKIQSDRAAFDIKIDNLNILIYECIENYKTKAFEEKIEIKTERLNDLPMVKIDREKIGWVINNLISNAIRYSDENGQIIIGACVKNDYINVSVRDNGRGIPKEYLEKVFEKFVRVEGFEVLPGSTGLGLSIAKEIVEAHNGSIWCDSVLGEGSVFTFTLPVTGEL